MSVLRTFLSFALRRHFASPIMSSLDLKMEGPLDPFSQKMFPILRDFLKLDKAMMESTANSILDLLPEKSPNSTDVWTFGEICIELVEQIPYHHPAQAR